MPRTVALPDASSMIVLPPATCTRPEARAGMSATVAPPSKPVHGPSRVSATSTDRMTVLPEVTVPARTRPETDGAAM